MKNISLILLSLLTSFTVSATSFKAQCLNIGAIKGMRSDDIASVCKTANKYTAACINIGRIRGMRGDHVAEACLNATSESTSCVNAARLKGMRGDRVAELCGSESPQASSEHSISTARLRLTLIDILSTIDSNPERAKIQVENILLELELE